jgi:hypothetical protein
MIRFVYSLLTGKKQAESCAAICGEAHSDTAAKSKRAGGRRLGRFIVGKHIGPSFASVPSTAEAA